MHSFGYRAYALLTFAVTVLAYLCTMGSIPDHFNSPSPTTQLEVLNINWFQKKTDGDDEVFVYLAAEYGTQRMP